MKYLLFSLMILTSCSWETSPSEIDKVNKTETIKVFALFPIDCFNHTTYWLKNVTIDRTYRWNGFFVYYQDHCIEGMEI